MEQCPIPFSYTLVARRNKTFLVIDAYIAELLDVPDHYTFFGGANPWSAAVRYVQILREEFEESWRDAHAID